MGEETAISWCDHTFNPWWGCWKIAPECKNCYAEAHAHRFVKLYGELWERTGPRRFFGDKHWDQLRKWNEKAKRDGVRRRVFIGSMCDWAEKHPNPEINRQMDAFRGRMWNEIQACDWLDFLMLSKRIDGVADLLPWYHVNDYSDPAEPWPNVWIGTTAGTRETLRDNLYDLRNIRAAVLFVSCEPLLEHITAEEWDDALSVTARCGAYPVDWLIVGDESGHHRRGIELDAVRTARDAAERHNVHFHYKQWNGDGKKIHLPILDGQQHAEFPA